MGSHYYCEANFPRSAAAEIHACLPNSADDGSQQADFRSYSPWAWIEDNMLAVSARHPGEKFSLSYYWDGGEYLWGRVLVIDGKVIAAQHEDELPPAVEDEWLGHEPIKEKRKFLSQICDG